MTFLVNYIHVILLCIQLCPLLAEKNRPNIIVLLADDLGRESLPSYGNNEEKVPNVERIFTEGAKFNHLLSPAALCTPSRSAFLTGRYPYRFGLGEGSNGPPVIVYSSSKVGLPRNESTWANLAQSLGYSTKAVGKWHMGMDEIFWGDQEHGPLTHGFDSFYGLPFTVVPGFEGQQEFWTLQRSNSQILITVIILLLLGSLQKKINKNWFWCLILVLPLFILFEHFDVFSRENWWWRSLWMERYLNSILVSNEKVVERPIQLKRLAERLTNESLKFIHQNVGVKPFLLYHAFHNLHKPVQVSDEFVGKGSGTPYSDSLVEMDYQIGRILDTLDDLSIQNNTIVFFASDHGKLGQNLPFKGGKGAPSLEGGVRIPGAIRWPNRIPSGFAINEPISLLDFFPTLNQILDTDYTLKKLDGKSFYESVSNHSSSIPRMLYHFCGIQIHALRYYDGRGSIIKGVFAKENLNSDGICSEGICNCAKAALIPSEQMDILNVTSDGKEEKLSSHAENEYRSLFLKTYNDFKKEKKPSQQLDSFFRVMPIYPRLHPGILPVHIKE